MKYNLICTNENLEGELKVLEMALNSLFDLRYSVDERIIYADNGNIRAKITKTKTKTEMKIVNITLNEPSKKYKIVKGSNFDFDMKSYKSLNIDIFEFENVRD